ncbi:hypothetical protein MPL1032_110051 [Mesorhizobium plurifarium]|uniref:Uncharacterized protein n=1 Tax=Mesorhizobium plurifarium TaxID=69974 RepID=A0A0K2VPX7_MESPL|nr:hypothetical protein MPL1032_110051 [Mesorhizobium plurifarium]
MSGPLPGDNLWPDGEAKMEF